MAGNGDTSFATQSDGDSAWVGVRSGGTDKSSGTPVASEFLIQDKSAGGEHVHIGFDEYGNQIFESRR